MIEILYIMRVIRDNEFSIKKLQKTAKAEIPLIRSADFQLFSNFLESY
jgi:hypothetical protein